LVSGKRLVALGKPREVGHVISVLIIEGDEGVVGQALNVMATKR
jgi:hypothetical protein